MAVSKSKRKTGATRLLKGKQNSLLEPVERMWSCCIFIWFPTSRTIKEYVSKVFKPQILWQCVISIITVYKLKKKARQKHLTYRWGPKISDRQKCTDQPIRNLTELLSRLFWVANQPNNECTALCLLWANTTLSRQTESRLYCYSV